MPAECQSLAEPYASIPSTSSSAVPDRTRRPRHQSAHRVGHHQYPSFVVRLPNVPNPVLLNFFPASKLFPTPIVAERISLAAVAATICLKVYQPFPIEGPRHTAPAPCFPRVPSHFSDTLGFWNDFIDTAGGLLYAQQLRAIRPCASSRDSSCSRSHHLGSQIGLPFVACNRLPMIPGTKIIGGPSRSTVLQESLAAVHMPTPT